MPYIDEKNRSNLDECINNMVECLKSNAHKLVNQHLTDNPLSNEEFLSILGDINYAFSRILGSLMVPVSYGKIAMITGVLENIKQEYYRRVASVYENQKIVSNGDIPEYKKFI